jgi:hypothetical protein
MKKIKIALVVLMVTLMVAGTTSYASFPVKTEPKKEQSGSADVTKSGVSSADQEIAKASTKAELQKPAQKQMDEDLLITLLLWFFLGGLAAHRWYKKKPAGWNILFILTLGGCGIWAIIDLINILTGKF